MKRFLFAVLAASALASVLASVPARADECREVDVRKKLTPEMQIFFADPRNQHDLSFCFAYATADLLSFRSQKPVSALEIGLTYSNSVTSIGSLFRNWAGDNVGDVNGGGSSWDALSVLKNRGYVCSEQDIRSTIASLVEPGEEIQKIQTKFLKQDRSSDDYIDNFILNIFPKMKDSQPSRTMFSMPHGSAAKILTFLSAQACANNKIAVDKNLQVVHFSKTSNQSLRNSLDVALNTGHMVALAYHPDNFLKPEFIASTSALTYAFGGHESVIIGRKKVNNQCMYVVRNSWGHNCGPYNDSVVCNAVEGTYAFPVGQFDKVVKDITYIKN